MNDSQERLTALASRARGDEPPFVDVTAAVLSRLHTRPTPAPSLTERILAGMALGSSLVAASALVWGAAVWASLDDPLLGLLAPLLGVMS